MAGKPQVETLSLDGTTAILDAADSVAGDFDKGAERVDRSVGGDCTDASAGTAGGYADFFRFSVGRENRFAIPIVVPAATLAAIAIAGCDDFFRNGRAIVGRGRADGGSCATL